MIEVSSLSRYRKAKIIATVGPACRDLDTLRAMIRAGADCFRLNFSHGDGESMLPVISLIREAESLENAFIPILADIQGPKIRIGTLPQEGIILKQGDRFTITTSETEGNQEIVSTSYKALPRDVQINGRILLADGTIELIVEDIQGNDVICQVVIGGRLTSNKGLNLPDTRLSVETLTEKDRRDLQFISTADIDIVAISFVRSSHDIIRAQTLLGDTTIPIIAKLERPEALENLNDIMEVANGVMVARGDLGVELEFAKVPLIQKKILHKAAERGKWAVVATQMLGSMVFNPRPSRAEVSDVANAVLDGADAVMLSEETAAGNHPVAAVRAMARIAEEASKLNPPYADKIDSDIVSFAAAAAGAAVSAANRLNAAAIVSLAGSGTTALLLSKWHPQIPVIGLASKPASLRRLNVLRGVIPGKIDGVWDMEKQVSYADRLLITNGLAKAGETVILVAAVPLGDRKETNTIRLHKVRPLNDIL